MRSHNESKHDGTPDGNGYNERINIIEMRDNALLAKYIRSSKDDLDALDWKTLDKLDYTANAVQKENKLKQDAAEQAKKKLMDCLVQVMQNFHISDYNIKRLAHDVANSAEKYSQFLMGKENTFFSLSPVKPIQSSQNDAFLVAYAEYQKANTVVNVHNEIYDSSRVEQLSIWVRQVKDKRIQGNNSVLNKAFSDHFVTAKNSLKELTDAFANYSNNGITTIAKKKHGIVADVLKALREVTTAQSMYPLTRQATAVDAANRKFGSLLDVLNQAKLLNTVYEDEHTWFFKGRFFTGKSLLTELLDNAIYQVKSLNEGYKSIGLAQKVLVSPQH